MSARRPPTIARYAVTLLVVVGAIAGGWASGNEPTPASETVGETSCHPSYDPCLDSNAYDYDCEGGEGDGPMYTGTVSVSGPDDFDLDRDGDGTGCDS